MEVGGQIHIHAALTLILRHRRCCRPKAGNIVGVREGETRRVLTVSIGSARRPKRSLSEGERFDFLTISCWPCSCCCCCSRLSKASFCSSNSYRSRTPANKIHAVLCRTIILPVVSYGCETWSLTLTFRHRASCILGQAFHYSPENAFYIFNQQIYFII